MQRFRPGDDALAKALVLVKAPCGEGQQAARLHPCRQRAHERLSLCRAGDVMQHTEQRHKIVFSCLWRMLDNIPRLQRYGGQMRQRRPRLRQQRRAAVHAVITQPLAQLLRQKQAEAPVATADIQHRQRRAQVRQQHIPARPRLRPCLVEAVGGHAVELVVDGVQAADGFFVHKVIEPRRHKDHKGQNHV